jgi:hypothetical protein
MSERKNFKFDNLKFQIKSKAKAKSSCFLNIVVGLRPGSGYAGGSETRPNERDCDSKLPIVSSVERACCYGTAEDRAGTACHAPLRKLVLIGGRGG